MFRYSLLFIIMVAMLTGCASNVIIDYDRAVDFKTFKTYTILPKSDKSTEDVRLSSPLVDKRIVQAIKQNMSQKGFRLKNTSADIQVKFRIDVKQEITSDSSGVTMVFGTGSARSGIGIAYSVPSGEVRSQDKGVLTIDFISSKTGELVWRGSNSRRIYDSGTPESSEKLINSIVKEIFEKYPPK